MLNQRVFKVDPLKCPLCHKSMKIVAIVDDASQVAVTLRRMRQWQELAPRGRLLTCARHTCQKQSGRSSGTTCREKIEGTVGGYVGERPPSGYLKTFVNEKYPKSFGSRNGEILESAKIFNQR